MLRRRLVPLMLAATLLGACGTGSDGDPGDSGSAPGGAEGMGGMEMSSMNEPGATPADKVDGDVTSGRFQVLATAPPGSDDVRGRAWVAQNDDGTTVTVRLTGLVPGTEYVSHLHEQACGSDAGGPHFRFDPLGSELPPNEVHLGFTADDAGDGTATVTNDQRVEQGAPAIVVHPAAAMDNKLACADLS